MGKVPYCIQIKFGVLKCLLYSPDEGHLCYFKFTYSSTQTKSDTRQDTYLNDIILALSWESRKLSACRNTSYTVFDLYVIVG